MQTNFRNTRFTLSETALLSQSTWTDGKALRFAVAILRKRGNEWDVESETAIESAVWAKSGSKAATESAETNRLYTLIDISSKLVAAEFGELPVRFYRDNVIEKGRKRSA